jgi:hypothetical protein
MEYSVKEYKLAVEIAESLQDQDSLGMHIKFVQMYAEAFLRKVLAKVLAIPQEKIRKTRGALNTALVKQQGHGFRPRN